MSNDVANFCHDLVPKLRNYLLFDKTEKPMDQVYRNYDYELNDIYSNLSDWNTSTITNIQSTKTKNNETKSVLKIAPKDSFIFENSSQKSNRGVNETLKNKNPVCIQEKNQINLEYLSKNLFKISEFKREFKNKTICNPYLGTTVLDSDTFTSENGSNTTGKSSSTSDSEFKREKKNFKKLSTNVTKKNPKKMETFTNIQEPIRSQFNFFEKRKFSDSSHSRMNESKSSRSLYENQFRRRSDTSSVSENMHEDTLVSSSPTEIKNFSNLPQPKQEKILRSILNEISSLNQKVDLKSKNHKDSKLTNSSLNTLDDADSDQDMAEFYSDFPESDLEENFAPYQNRTKYFGNYNYFDSKNNDSFDKQIFNIDQDWSLSQNSTYNLNTNEHRVVNEVLKNLKPFMVKCVRKEVRKYFQKSKNSNRFDSSMTKIGDF